MDSQATRALIVEDSPRMRELLHVALGGLGKVEVIEAQNGAEALDALKCGGADIVIMEWKMEVMDGLECTRQIRAGAHAIDPQTPVVLLTGLVSSESESAGYAAGVNLFMGKPISLKKLQTGLMQVLNEKKGTKTLVQ